MAVAAFAGCLIALLLVSCNTTGCTENRSSIPLAGFYDIATGKSIVLDSIEIGGVGAPNDSLLLTAGVKASEVYLPLRQRAERASFFIAYRTQALDYPQFVDTLTISYTSHPYFASEECGAMLRYHIRDIAHTTTVLDSVAVIPADSIITNIDIENMKLFFRVTTTEAS